MWRALTAVLLVLVACGSSSNDETKPPARTEVSLRSDVIPIFQASCATAGTCHGAPSGIEIYLAVDASKASDLRKRTVGVASEELSSMPYVTAGDPTRSYLMHKLDGDQGTLQCTGSIGCGDQMPREAPPLDGASRDRIRAWIAQGALDD